MFLKKLFGFLLAFGGGLFFLFFFGAQGGLKVKVKLLSHLQLFATSWPVAHQSPLSMGFSRQEYWSGLPFPSPGDLPNPGIEPRSPAPQADALTCEPPGFGVTKAAVHYFTVSVDKKPDTHGRVSSLGLTRLNSKNS